MSRLVLAFLRWLVPRLEEPRVIRDRDGGTAYLARWYLIGERPAVDRFGNPITPRKHGNRVQVYLHRFLRSDHDGELHSHPWQWAVAIVLAGGYLEERRVGDRVVVREVRPGSINIIRADDYHRVDLIGLDSWSLFIAGPKASTWFFWCRERLARSPWRSFLAWKQDGAPHAEWQDDRRGDA